MRLHPVGSICIAATRVGLALGLAVVAASAVEATANADLAPQPGASSAEMLIAINTVCPVDGERIDPQIPPVRARTVTGRIIGIGVCSRACADLVRKDPDRYIEDAIGNHRHRDGADAKR